MSFQAYIDNIKTKTGKTPEDFKKLAAKKGLLEPGVKATAITDWLKKEFGLGHGHAMAIYAVFKGHKASEAPVKKTTADFPAKLAAPAQRALAAAGITTLKQLAKHSEADIAALHGIGQNALTALKTVLTTNGLSFKKSKP